MARRVGGGARCTRSRRKRHKGKIQVRREPPEKREKRKTKNFKEEKLDKNPDNIYRSCFKTLRLWRIVL